MTEHEWRAINWGYEVSRCGLVRSTSTNWRGYGVRLITPIPHGRDGYLAVRLQAPHRRIRLYVHKVVAQAFLAPPEFPNAQIRHLDGDHLHNDASNLAWGTAKDNAQDRDRHGRTSRGSRHSESIRNSGQAEGVRRRFLAAAIEKAGAK